MVRVSDYSVLQPPTNYSGSKHKLIHQMMEYFPDNVDVFYDVFCGGLSVTMNTNYGKYISNDIITPLIGFYQNIYNAAKSNNINFEIEKILQFKINKDSQDDYNKLRFDFNQDKDPYKFFSLVSSCTNNLMRFNLKMEFNQTWGKRNINDKTIEKLRLYMERLETKDILFKNYNFIELFEENFPNTNDFVYFDPPYIQTEAGYNTIWSKKMEDKLFHLMKKLTDNNIKFAYSNVSMYKGVENPNMGVFKQYNIIELDHSYEKVARNKGGINQEVLILNY